MFFIDVYSGLKTILSSFGILSPVYA